MLVTGGTHAGEFFRLLGNGHEYGIERLFYAYQDKPGGIAEALGLAERFGRGGRIVVMLADNVVERSLAPAVENFRGAGARRADPARSARGAGAPAPSRRRGARRRPGYPHPREARGAAERVRGHRDLLLRRAGLGRAADARALRPRRARDHGREQLVRRAGPDGVRRARGVLGRRRRVDRRVLRGQRLRPRATARTRNGRRRPRNPAAALRGRTRLVHGADAGLAAASARAAVESRLVSARA